jgi:hypothetical protein
MQTSKKVEFLAEKEVSLRKVLNAIGVFIFGALALTIVTNPIVVDEIKNFILFIFSSAIIYFFLVNIYFLGGLWRYVFYASLIFISDFSLFMVFYLSTNSMPH